MPKYNKKERKICDICNGSGKQPNWNEEYFTKEEKFCWLCLGRGSRYIKKTNNNKTS